MKSLTTAFDDIILCSVPTVNDKSNILPQTHAYRSKVRLDLDTSTCTLGMALPNGAKLYIVSPGDSMGVKAVRDKIEEYVSVGRIWSDLISSLSVVSGFMMTLRW